MNVAYLSSIGVPISERPAATLTPPEEDPKFVAARGPIVEAKAPSSPKASSSTAPAKPAKQAASPKAKPAAKAASADAKAPKSASSTATNFLQEWIEGDLAPGGRCADRVGKKDDVIRCRFPPEPNGYLHIGHAKSICINFGNALKYGGRTHLRFDDTNPAAEETEYVDSIKEDVKWLGFDWGEHLCFTSDYFDQLYEWAEHLIKNGKAYVDSQSREDMKKNRGNVTTPGTNSAFRTRSAEENLKLFREMKAGKHAEGTHVVRAMVDMASPNMNMRDPPIYRILHKEHHRTGTKWKVYPIYDFAHGQSDAIEGITHSICTTEFEAHRPLYEWFIENLPIETPPMQREFARLNVTNTVMSKRKLLTLVREKVVDGWDDPRMPTICGMRRRGVRPEALKNFVERVGVTKGLSVTDVNLLEEIVRNDLDPIVDRRMVVLHPLKVTITDYPDKQVEEVEALNHPSKPEMGTRKLKFSKTLWIERDDFREDASDDYFRLKPDGEVKLRYSYAIKVKEIVKNKAGEVIELKCTHDPESRDKLPGKIKGVIHWVSADHCATASSVRLYDYLLKSDGSEVAEPEKEEEDGEEPAAAADPGFMKMINPESLVELKDVKIELSLLDAKPFDRFQFERNAFFVIDKNSKAGQPPVFNRIVGLKETGLKKEEDSKAQARSRKDEQAKQAAAKEAMKSIDPCEMFKSQTDLYSAFDEDGVPTLAADSEPLPKSRIKKLRAEWEKQKKLFGK